jgi:hypothetical protein
MPRFGIDTTATPPSYRLDSHGNVVGGIRTPAVDVPQATLSGLPAAGAPGFCDVFGQTHPFTPSQLAALYPTHRAFLGNWTRAVQRDLAAGALLPTDAKRLVSVASGS